MAVDTVARALALSMLGTDGNVSPDKLPVFNTTEPTTFEVGGLVKGTNINGKNVYEVLQLMLFGGIEPDYPTLTDPSFVLNNVSGLIGTVGSNFTITGTAVYNRGSIVPAYGTDGYRSGAPTSYSINGETQTTSALSIPFSTTINSLPYGETIVEISVNYSAGEQPLDSQGGNYETAYPAGSMTQELIVMGIYPILTSFEGIEHLEPNPLTTYFNNNGTGYEVYIDGEEIETDGKQVFAVYKSTPVVGVQQYDEGRQVWDWIYGSPEDSLDAFTIGETTFEIFGVSVTYTTYTNALEAMGGRTLRVFTELSE